MNILLFLKKLEHYPENCILSTCNQTSTGSFLINPIKYLILKNRPTTIDLYPATESALLENRTWKEEFLTLKETVNLIKGISKSISYFDLEYTTCVRFALRSEKKTMSGPTGQPRVLETFWAPEQFVTTYHQNNPIIALSSVEADKYVKHGY